MSDSEHDWLRPEEEHEIETVIDAGTAQSNPEVARQILSVLAREVSSTAALGATLGAIMLTYISGKAAKNGE